MTEETISVKRRRRPLDQEDYQLRNLRFLGDFMRMRQLSTTQAGAMIGMTQVGVYYWFKRDDARLSQVDKLIAACGYSLNFEFLDREQETNPLISIEVARTKRLSFLSEALDSLEKKKDVAGKLGLASSTIYYWLTKDDIFISYIYKIAEIIGKKVKVTIRQVRQP